MKLTKETAIILTYQLWKWMQERRGIRKFDWPGFKTYGHMQYDCPCCEYGWQRDGGRDCIKDCPLIGIWPAKKVSIYTPCGRKKSPYVGFQAFGVGKRNPAIINKMVTAIEGEMKRLGIKNREIKP